MIKLLAHMQDNPLLDIHTLPRFEDIRVEHIVPAVETVLQDNRSVIVRLETLNEGANWENFAVPLEAIEDRLNRVFAPISHLNGVMDEEELRIAYETCLSYLSDYHTDLGQNEGLYRGFKAIANSPEYATFDSARRKIVTDAIRDFHLSGVDLLPEKKKRFKEISERLSSLGNRFGQNLLDSTDAWSMTLTHEDEIAGVPQSTLDMARQEAEAVGDHGWRFTLKAPSYLPFMTYADNRELRRKMYTAYVTRASENGPGGEAFDNTETIDEILRLRHELAALAGFPNYAEYSLETKMATDVNEVETFLTNLAGRSKSFARRELAELQNFARNTQGANDLKAWDLAYYSEKLKEETFKLSQESLRPWFPLPKVINGMFDVVGRLFGVTVKPVDDIQLWHPDARFFEIRDVEGMVCGQFYVDLYARNRKRGGAWMGECVSRRMVDGEVQIPVAFLVCNFSPPVGDSPSLLTHDEVTTLFHEFGHGLHHMLTRVDYASVSGINGVEWDAVELPSQFLENWCWESQALDLISGHVETGESLPVDMLDKLRAGKNFQVAMQMLRQIEFSLFDIRLHGGYQLASNTTVQSVLDQVRDEVAVVIPPAFNRFQNGFSHIFGGGYAAGYYSYKWAEVLSADAFECFLENGIFDSDTGNAFLVNILEKGGSQDAMDLFVAFRGRRPDIESLLEQSGLAA